MSAKNRLRVTNATTLAAPRALDTPVVARPGNASFAFHRTLWEFADRRVRATKKVVVRMGILHRIACSNGLTVHSRCRVIARRFIRALA